MCAQTSSRDADSTEGHVTGEFTTHHSEEDISGSLTVYPHKTKTDPSRAKDIRSRRKAVFFNVIATSVMSISTLLMKMSKMRGNEITLCTGLFGVFLGIIGFIVSSRKGRTFTNRTLLRALIGGTIFGGLFSFLYFLSFDYITMGDTTTVNFFAAFACCLIFESVLLKLKPHILTIVAGTIGLVGVVLICQPEGLFKLKVDARYTGLCRKYK